MNSNVCFLFYWHAVKVHIQFEPSAGHDVVILAFRESCPRGHVDSLLFPSPQAELTLAHLWFS